MQVLMWEIPHKLLADKKNNGIFYAFLLKISCNYEIVQGEIS